MIPKRLDNPQLEAAFDQLAEAIDAAGPQRELFLAKLALILANQLADPRQLAEAIAAALRDLPPARDH